MRRYTRSLLVIYISAISALQNWGKMSYIWSYDDEMSIEVGSCTAHSSGWITHAMTYVDLLSLTGSLWRKHMRRYNRADRQRETKRTYTLRRDFIPHFFFSHLLFVCEGLFLRYISTIGYRPHVLLFMPSCRGSRFVSPALSLWTALVTLLVGALLGFHAYLLSKGQTTNEYLRGEKRRGNVPHRSFFPNCGQLWCGKQPPR